MPIPVAGRIVMYHHPEDLKDWPAMILEVTGAVKQQDQPISVGGDGAADVPPVAVEAVSFLQIARPRKTEWKRAVEGEGPGTWSWPVTSSGHTVASPLDRIEALEAMVFPDGPPDGTEPIRPTVMDRLAALESQVNPHQTGDDLATEGLDQKSD